MFSEGEQSKVCNILRKKEINMGPRKWEEEDTADETDVTVGEVRRAWHNAREDCQRSDDDYDKNLRKDWDREEKEYVTNEDEDE